MSTTEALATLINRKLPNGWQTDVVFDRIGLLLRVIDAEGRDRVTLVAFNCELDWLLCQGLMALEKLPELNSS